MSSSKTIRIRPTDSVDQGDDSGVVVEPDDETGGQQALVQVTIKSPSATPPVASKFEKFKKSSNSNTLKTVTGSNGTAAMRAMKSIANKEEFNRVQSGDVDITNATSFAASKAKLELDDFVAESSQAKHANNQIVRAGDNIKTSTSLTKGLANKVTAADGTMSQEQIQFQSKNAESLVSPTGSRYFQKNNSGSRSHYVTKTGSGITTTTSTSSSSSSMVKTYTSGSISNLLSESFDGTPLSLSNSNSNMLGFTGLLALAPGGRSTDSILKYEEASERKTIECEFSKAEKKVGQIIEKLKNSKTSKKDQIIILPPLRDNLKKAWVLLGNECTYRICDKLRTSGALDILIDNLKCEDASEEQIALRDISASVLQYCLSIPNVTHVLSSPDVNKVVTLAASVNEGGAVNSLIRAGIGIIANLYLSSEETCKELIKRGTLETVLAFSRTVDSETCRNCAFALANLALFGGPECHSLMIEANAHQWLFYLGFNHDETVVYLASHAIAALVSNKEIEATILKSNLTPIVESFLSRETPQEFAAKATFSRMYGQSKEWLKKCSSILDSDREEAKTFAAFHFALTALHKKRQGDTSIFKEIGVIELLNRVASSPNANASKYAAQALRAIGAEVPHKLSQQVPLWSVDDVKEWVKQINFATYAENFQKSGVDGDLLLQITEENLKEDIGIKNGILRKRFLRELAHLQRITDYSAVDQCKLTDFLESIGQVYLQYVYNMLNSGVDEQTLKTLTEEQLMHECKIDNSIHRWKILQSVKTLRDAESTELTQGDSGKNLDVFVSYRRSTGSQLASLLKVLLQMRGFSTFLDIERLEAGKFDCNLINSIRQAKHFILVLTPSALDRCIGDDECKDWVHREIVEALKSNCNIIPVISNYELPEPEQLPADMRAVCSFNGIRWIHEYQDACVEKLDRFMKGVLTSGELEMHNGQQLPNSPPATHPPCSSVALHRY